MAEAAAGLSLAATGLKAFGGLAGGMAGAANAEARGKSAFMSSMLSAEEAEIAAARGELKATQTDSFLRQQTSDTLANVMAVRSAAGTDSSSPTGAAVMNNFHQRADDARVIQTSNIRADAAMQRMNAMMYRMGGMQALSSSQSVADTMGLNGILGAGGSILSGLAGLKFG